MENRNLAPEKLKILLVEDNLIAQKSTKSLLTALQCDVDIAVSGDEAINLFRPGKYALIFMDIELQDSSGYIIAKSFRNDEKNTQYRTPIIALTMHKAQSIQDVCKEFGIDDAVSKPLTNDLAKQLLQHYVEQKSR